MRERSMVHADRGPRATTSVWLQSRVCSSVHVASGRRRRTWVKLQSRVWTDRGQEVRLNLTLGLSPRRPLQSRSLMPGHAAASAAGRRTHCRVSPADVLGRVHVSAEVQALTARRRLRQVARSPFLPSTSDTTRARRRSGRLTSRGAGSDSASLLPPTETAGTAVAPSRYFLRVPDAILQVGVRLCQCQ